MSAQPFESMSPAGQQAVVQITLGQVYNEVQQTHEAVRGLTSALEPIKDRVMDHEARLRAIEPQAGKVKDLEGQVDKHTSDISAMRIKQALWTGGAIVAATGASSLIAYALSH